MPIIEARELAKTYPAQPGRRVLLGRGGIGAWLRGQDPPRQALAPLSLSVEPGEALGIIGRNGSGKSTLLKLIAGVTTPSFGSLAVRGRAASLLELGAGFHPMLTGRENVYLNAGLLGMRHAKVDAVFDAIVDFSEIGESIDQTVDTYSSGMYVRLAFSVAVHTNPDIFLVDEVLSVGDEGFQRKCRARILELKEAGKTILFVSHDLGIVNTLCDRVILLDRGELLSRGGAQDTIDFYLRQIGRASGVHRLRANGVEALFNHGRVSLFHEQREVTSPLGIKAQFFSMGQYHESTAAEWTVTVASDTELQAEGVLPRLPVTIFLRVRIDNGCVHVEVAWENHRPIDLTYAALQCFLPVSFTRWQSGGESGEFPAIAVTSRQWSNVVDAAHDPGPCFLLGDTVAVRIDAASGAVPLQLDNTDYMAQARLAHVTEAFSSSLCPLAPARRTLASFTLDPTAGAGAAEAARRIALDTRTVQFPRGSAYMNRGAIVVTADCAAITRGLHLHMQFKIGGIWILSHALQWSAAEIVGDVIQASGYALRFPFAILWSMKHTGDGLAVEAQIEVMNALRIEEYNVSIALCDAYTHWEMPEELGRFEVEGGGESWRHLNTRYAPGDWILASSATFPAVAMRAESTLGSIHPTAILAQGVESTPVIQLLCSPGPAGGFAIGPGLHALINARISIGAERDE